MKNLHELKKSKKGFTLVEMIVTTIILSILMSITLGMISSTGRLYDDTARMGIDKAVGDSVFNALESTLKYSTHLQIGETPEEDKQNSKPNEEKKDKNPYEQQFFIADKDNNPVGSDSSGYLRYNSTSKDAKEGTEKNKGRYKPQVFDVDFYQGRTVSYEIQPYEYESKDKKGETHKKISGKHVILRVVVHDKKGKVTYSTGKKTIRCVNLGLLNNFYKTVKTVEDGEVIKKEEITNSKSNDLTYYAENKKNPNIYFNLDEELAASEQEGAGVYNDVQSIVGEYNLINEDLCIKLNEPNITEIQKQEASNEAKKKIVDLLGITPASFSQSSLNPSMYKYFDGVQATKYELFYGMLIKKAGKGKKSVDVKNNPSLKKEDFLHFKDKDGSEPDGFFKNTTFNGYYNKMIKLVNFYMHETTLDDSQKYQPSQIDDFNMYSVQWDDWFNYVDVSNVNNCLGRIKDGKRSYQECLIVFHPLRMTWYYMPADSTWFSHFWSRISKDDELPITYDIKDKGSEKVVTDIDSNTVAKYKEYEIGIFWRRTIRVDKSEAIVWNALPAYEFGSKYK